VVNPGYAVPIGIEFLSAKNAGAAIAGNAPKLIRAKGATLVKVTFSGLSSMSGGDEGVIVVKGGASPLVRETKVSRGLQPWNGFDWPVILVIGAFVAMLLLAGGIACFASAFDEGNHLKGKAPGPKWSFSRATTLTAVGALLGTIVTVRHHLRRGPGRARLLHPPRPGTDPRHGLVGRRPDRDHPHRRAGDLLLLGHRLEPREDRLGEGGRRRTKDDPEPRLHRYQR
jgi:hypothetical protein